MLLYVIKNVRPMFTRCIILMKSYDLLFVSWTLNN